MTPQIWFSHVAHMNKSRHTRERVVLHIWMSSGAHTNESCRTWTTGVHVPWVISRTWLSHVTHMNKSCHTYEWVMSHICTTGVRTRNHEVYMDESCCTYEWVVSHIWTTGEHVLWAMSCCMHESRMSHDTTHMDVSRHTYEWQEYTFRESCRTYEWVTSHIRMSHVWISHGAHINESCHTYERVKSHIWMTGVHDPWAQQVQGGGGGGASQI